MRPTARTRQNLRVHAMPRGLNKRYTAQVHVNIGEGVPIVFAAISLLEELYITHTFP